MARRKRQPSALPSVPPAVVPAARAMLSDAPESVSQHRTPVSADVQTKSPTWEADPYCSTLPPPELTVAPQSVREPLASTVSVTGEPA